MEEKNKKENEKAIETKELKKEEKNKKENEKAVESKELQKEEKQTVKEKIKAGINKIRTADSKIKKYIIGIIVAILILVIISRIFINRSAKSRVKDVADVAENLDIVGAINLIDLEGIAAFYSCYDYEKGEIDLDDFDEKYENIKEINKKARKELKKCKYSIKVTSSKKMPESKKITRVTCDLEITYKENNIKLKGIKIYTMKKGIENYIIGIDPESIEKISEQLEKQSDEIEDIGEDLEEILEDIQDLVD